MAISSCMCSLNYARCSYAQNACRKDCEQTISNAHRLGARTMHPPIHCHSPCIEHLQRACAELIEERHCLKHEWLFLPGNQP